MMNTQFNSHSRYQRITDLSRRLRLFRDEYRKLECSIVTTQIQQHHSDMLLLRIVEGEDRANAVEEARAWLREVYKERYDVMTRIALGMKEVVEELRLNTVLGLKLQELEAEFESDQPRVR